MLVKVPLYEKVFAPKFVQILHTSSVLSIKRKIFLPIFFLKRGVASLAPFNAWGNGNINLIFFLHQVVTFCYIGRATEPFFENYCYKVVILIDLDVHAELGIITKMEILFIFYQLLNNPIKM